MIRSEELLDGSTEDHALVRTLEEKVRALEDELRFFRALADELPLSLYHKDREGRCVWANAALLESVGSGLEGALGKTVFDYYPRELAEKYDADDRHVVETGETWQGVEEHQAPTSSEGARYVEVKKVPVRDADGAITGSMGIYWDVTGVRRAERLEEERRAQAVTLRELGAPLLPLADRVLAMPLIGRIDGARAAQALDSLLHGVSERQAAVVLLDVTGVTMIDDEVVRLLVDAARAVRLLGAQVVLTGVKAAMAQAMIEMDARLDGIVTLSTMQAGVAWALGRRK
ncbi:PAS domain-containing protein [Polyangium jinanense]|uniref:PAS domain-containing protein n=1 Tax=Polyangium jinanense TaxID=2829994 RepID=A0A9X3X795_9BACT|nr:PAS domain-containing protein [Polyangium jinanense]MDC3985079.1 PAS domain-containing protein [Polyangium jinanense]